MINVTIDEWGNELYYKLASDGLSYNLFSFGKDSTPNTEDDIKFENLIPKMKHIYIVFIILVSTMGFAQDISEEKLLYYQVPEYAKEFTAGTMVARMVDALGFRFY